MEDKLDYIRKVILNTKYSRQTPPDIGGTEVFYRTLINEIEEILKLVGE